MESVSDRVRLRLREEMERKRLSTRDVAGLLNWSQSKVSKLIAGRVELGIDEAAELCFAVSLQLVEAIRDRGLEFYAEMTPVELRILERLKQLPGPVRDAVMTLLRVNETTPQIERGATKRKPIFGPIRSR